MTAQGPDSRLIEIHATDRGELSVAQRPVECVRVDGTSLVRRGRLRFVGGTVLNPVENVTVYDYESGEPIACLPAVPAADLQSFFVPQGVMCEDGLTLDVPDGMTVYVYFLEC